MFPIYNTTLLIFVTVGVNTCIYYNIKPMRYSHLLDDKYKFIANVRDKDLKITKIHYFVTM